MRKIFKFMVFAFLENALNLWILLMPPFPTQNSRQKLLKICFPQQQKGVERTLICFVKIQSWNVKMAWNIRLCIFCMICNFSKCNDFTVCKNYLSYSVVFSLLPFHYNHGNLTLKFHPKKIATLMKCGFLLVDSKLEVYQEW